MPPLETDIKPQLSDARKNVKEVFALVDRIGRGGTFLDLGSNIGEVAIECASLFDRVVTVEANPSTFEFMAARVAASRAAGKIEVINRAVCGDTGKTYLVSNPKPLSIGARARPTARGRRNVVPVETVSLRDLIASHDPRIVKMDIEGCEFEALADVSSLPLGGVAGMIIELHKRGDAARAIADGLEAAGFIVDRRNLDNHTKRLLTTIVVERNGART